ncbi:hypothetical protein A0H81_06023 [Grifola frondosa]|uniref:Uncharacterized protein n=1 Tax=Grifola frondosa TaxID=5627 RepID=A0A1C7M9G1_GRIFR|nr:hypothetical protein A0H81_06023 [Grifola frondosa]
MSIRSANIKARSPRPALLVPPPPTTRDMTRRASFTDNHPHPSSARFVSVSHAVIDGDPHSALTAFKQRELLSPAGRPERQGYMRLELMRSVETQLRAEDDATRKRFAESLGLVRALSLTTWSGRSSTTAHFPAKRTPHRTARLGQVKSDTRYPQSTPIYSRRYFGYTTQ